VPSAVSSSTVTSCVAFACSFFEGQLLRKCLLDPQIKQRLFLQWCSFSSGRSLPLGLRFLAILSFLSWEVDGEGMVALDAGFGVGFRVDGCDQFAEGAGVDDSAAEDLGAWV
jgi:hypothetical protein